MPVIGERSNANIGKGVFNERIKPYAEQFKQTAENILNESGVDLFIEPMKSVLIEGSNDTLKDFFIENSYDPDSMSTEEIDDHIEMMSEQFENDREAVLEYASMNSYNPVIGLSFPLHKNILMNCIFDKGAIPKVVAKSPKFTITMENRYLVTPEGKKIDIYKNQEDITDAIENTAPLVEVELNLPEIGETDILSKIGASSVDNISIETYISAVKVALKESFKVGEKLPDGTIAKTEVTEAWFPVKLHFKPSYGEYDRTCMEPIVINDSHADPTKNSDVISGVMQNNKFKIASMQGNVLAIKLKCRKDTSNAMLQTCSVAWDSKTVIEEIPPAIPINTPVSPDEVKDIGALYNVNQLSKIMSMFNIILQNYKDDKIKRGLDESYLSIPKSQKKWGVFDFAPRENYLETHVEWRQKTFMDYLDSHVTDLLQVLNDPNVVITVFGRPDLIRKITPTEYTYKSPSNIGPIELEFRKTVVTSDNRTYQFISSQKLKNSNELIIILCPRNTQRIIYRIYDYQMYVTNEIRNASNYSLPAIHAFERWKFVEYQPVQGRMRILNPTGLREGKDIPTLGSLGTVGTQNNIITDMSPTTN